MTAAKGEACWCPNPECDEVIDLTAPKPFCAVCATEVCKACQQEKHAGPCVAALDASLTVKDVVDVRRRPPITKLARHLTSNQ